MKAPRTADGSEEDHRDDGQDRRKVHGLTLKQR